MTRVFGELGFGEMGHDRCEAARPRVIGKCSNAYNRQKWTMKNWDESDVSEKQCIVAALAEILLWATSQRQSDTSQTLNADANLPLVGVGHLGFRLLVDNTPLQTRPYTSDYSMHICTWLVITLYTPSSLTWLLDWLIKALMCDSDNARVNEES